MKSTYIVIMAGGIGSRFWPSSTEEKPKQFLDMLGIGKSLLRLTFERFGSIVAPENIYVVTNEKYRDQVSSDLPELSQAQILGEPSRNNTAPCIAYAAFKIRVLDPAANLVIAPSDHFIAQEGKFLEVLRQGLDFTAKNDAILTLGMHPTYPATGYGYIELGNENYVSQNSKKDQQRKANSKQPIFPVKAFNEKPDLVTAEKYLNSGRYVWNSGLFLFRAETILMGFNKYATQIYDVLVNGEELYNTDQEKTFLKVWYPKTEKISIDYAIMEKANNIYCLPADFGWTDLGSWGALYDHLGKNQDNVTINGQLYSDHSTGNLVLLSKPKQVILKDLHDYMVIDEEDILLIYPLKDEQDIKHVSARVTQNNG